MTTAAMAWPDEPASLVAAGDPVLSAPGKMDASETTVGGDDYRYLATLVRTVAAWRARTVADDPAAFVYRGADLRFAAERTLYFMLRDDQEARRIFKTSADAPAALARYIAAGDGRVGGRPNGRARHEGRVLLDLRRQTAARTLRMLFTCEQARVRALPEVLFLVLARKMVDFLEPIVRAMGSKAAFVTFENRPAAAYIAERGLPSFNIRLTPLRRLIVGPGGALEPFAWSCRHYDAFRALFARAPVGTIVLPEGNEPIHEAINQAAHAAGVRSVCLQYGWSPYIHNGFQNLSYDAMLVWGQMFADMLAPHSPQQRFVVTGTPLPMAAVPVPRSGAARAIGFFLQHINQLSSQAKWQEFLSLIGWTAESFSKQQVIIRTHPSKPRLDEEELARIGHRENVQFMSPGMVPLADVLARSDIVVAPFSTVLLEAVAAGAIPFIFGSDLPRFWPDLAGMGAAIEEHRVDAAKARLQRLVSEPDFCSALRVKGAALRPELFSLTGNEAVDRIVAELADVEQRAVQ